jgi:hypothetical protein
LDFVPPEPDVPEPAEPIVPELPEELEALPGDPLAPEVSVARRSHPTAVRLKAASTNKTFEVFLRMFMPVPFMKMLLPVVTLSLATRV